MLMLLLKLTWSSWRLCVVIPTRKRSVTRSPPLALPARPKTNGDAAMTTPATSAAIPALRRGVIPSSRARVRAAVVGVVPAIPLISTRPVPPAAVCPSCASAPFAGCPFVAARATDQPLTSWRMDSWATFDCYGTLVDWNAGIGAQLERLLAADRAELLARYHELEPQVQARDPALPYRQVMARVLEEMADER